MASSSLGRHAHASPECVAGGGLGEWFTTRPLAVEPSWPTDDSVHAVGATYRYRRSQLQALYVTFEAVIEKLSQRVAEQACERPGAQLLMTHPGVGPVTALATEVFLSDPTRFADGKALDSYVGIIPREYSSGGRQKLGGLDV